MSKEKFLKDLSISQQTENEFKALLEQFGYNVTTTQDKGHFPGYDLIVEGRSGKEYIEIKHDLKCAKTGNVAVELFKEKENQVLASGLTVTKADLVVYKLADDPTFYGYTPTELFEAIEQKHHKKYLPNIGDGNRTTIALFDIAYFKKNGRKINQDSLKTIS